MDNEIREMLAKATHEMWAHWMRYLFSRAAFQYGQAWINSADVERWTRQMKTPYEELHESEKDSDRDIADRFLLSIFNSVKPSWNDAPEWATELNGEWYWIGNGLSFGAGCYHEDRPSAASAD